MIRLAAAITCAMAIAACGSSGRSAGAASAASSSNGFYKYSDCMRANGVTNFPDPQISGNGGHQSFTIRLDPAIASSPAFKSAQKACAYLVHAQITAAEDAQPQAQTDALLAFARCMRKHGFSRFPDPSTQGQPWTLTMLSNAGINLNEPAVLPAALACTSVTHGILTKADVENAVANPSELGSQAPAAP